jgi:flagellar assembly factor FliW
MKIESNRFGTIEIDDAHIIQFQHGLLGFEELTQFAIFESEEAAPLRYLLSIQDSDLAFLIVDPYLFFSDYEFDLSKEDRKLLGLLEENQDELAIAVVVNVPEDVSQMTGNLMGPIIFNVTQKLGKQIVLHDSGYSTKQLLLSKMEATKEAILAS